MARKKQGEVAAQQLDELEKGELIQLRGACEELERANKELEHENGKLREVTVRQTMQLVDALNEVVSLRSGEPLAKAKRDLEEADEQTKRDYELTRRLHGDREALVNAIIRLAAKPPTNRLGTRD